MKLSLWEMEWQDKLCFLPKESGLPKKMEGRCQREGNSRESEINDPA